VCNDGHAYYEHLDVSFAACISYARCIGRPLYHFSLVDDVGGGYGKVQRLNFKFVVNDHLLAAGGLESISGTGWQPPPHDAVDEGVLEGGEHAIPGIFVGLHGWLGDGNEEEEGAESDEWE